MKRTIAILGVAALVLLPLSGCEEETPEAPAGVDTSERPVDDTNKIGAPGRQGDSDIQQGGAGGGGG